MPDVKNTINGLQQAIDIMRRIMPNQYWFDIETPCNDAIALLKAQEPPTDIAIGNVIFCLQNPHDCLEDEVEEARKMALDAMKALEPIEPVILVQDVNLSNGAKYICGKCGGSFFNQQVNYCPWCGKAVKWGDA